jgi:hypothetical protein
MRNKDSELMWKIRKAADGNLVVLCVSGRIGGAQLVDLQEALASEGETRDIVLDLEEVKLVDREAVRFLARWEADGAGLRNCPAYIREWITRERTKG